MLSVEASCAFAFSLGREGLTSDHLELHWVLLPIWSIVFVFSGLTQPEGITPAKDLRSHPHAVWWSYGSLGRWVSEICTWPCENTCWRSPLWALRHRLWDSSCSCSLTQSLCLWDSRITTMTLLINKNEWDICDRMYPVKTFIMEGLHDCNVVSSSLHRITWDDVSCFMEDTLQKSSNIFIWFFIASPATPSPTSRPSVYISMVHLDRLRRLHQRFVCLSTYPWFHHDDIYVVSFDWIFVCGFVLSWCMCVCMCTHGGQSYFLYLEWKRFTTLSFWRTENIWILRVGKIIYIFSFMRIWRRNFYFFFIRISVVVSIIFFLFPLQTCDHSTLLGSSHTVRWRWLCICIFSSSLPRISSRISSQFYFMNSVFGLLGNESVFSPGRLDLLGSFFILKKELKKTRTRRMSR
jgi:hypothetical protein